MSDKKYPYIGQLNGTEFKVLFVKPNTGTQLRVNIYSDDWCEDDYKNITPEYLSNTWGLVESKEHAEFIIQLAELHGFEYTENTEYCGFFTFGYCGLTFLKTEKIASSGMKQITIPLHPKAALDPVEQDKFPSHKTSTQYLKKCIDVQSQRGEQYDSKGTGERSFAAAASAFNAMTGGNIKGSDICLILTCVKAVRQYSNPERIHDDSLLDGISYMALWGEELNKEINNGK